MGINLFYNILSNLIMKVGNLFPSVLSALNFAFNVTEMESKILNFFVQLFYSISKWILCFVDIVFSYIKKLCGLDMDFTSLSGIFSTDSDMVFNLLITAQDRAIAIFKNLLVLAIILIIIFTIVALIKSQYDSLKKGSPTSVMETIKKTIKAFVLLLITPFIAIGGIVFSDLLLQSLYRATNTTGGMTLGTQVFSSAASAANSYRIYAQSDARIPIVCDFSKEKEILQYYEGNPISEAFSDYLTSAKNLIFVTYMSFYNNEFISFSSINDILDSSKKETKNMNYYGIYDYYNSGDAEEDARDQFLPYRRIEAYAEEYYVMADVIEFSVNTGNTLYIKSIQDVLDSICAIKNEAIRENTFRLMVQQYDIHFYKSAVTDDDGNTSLTDETRAENSNYISAELYKRGNWKALRYMSNYISADASGEPSTLMQIPYVHIKDEFDELTGAKFIMAVEKEVTLNYNEDGTAVTQKYYVPLSNGYSKNYNTSFNSQYIMNGQIISAKGTFESSIYPTAIKKTGDEGELITFYREDVASAASSYTNDLMKASGIPTSGISAFFKMIQAFFNPDSVDISVELNLDSVTTTYDSEPIDYNTIADGKVQLSYFMKYTASSTNWNKNACELSISELFIPRKINVLLIAVAPVLLVKVCLTAFMGLITRSYELFLILLFYPAACATIPLDNKAYDAWWKAYMQRLFQTYGLILGINFVFMLFPIITSLTYFSQSDLATTKVVYKICKTFFGNLTIYQLTAALNLFVTILFELVAFTLIEEVPKMINEMVGAIELKNNVLESVKKIFGAIKKVTKVIVKVVDYAIAIVAGTIAKKPVKEGQKKSERAIENFKKLQNFKRLLPGSKLLDRVKEKGNERAKAKDKKVAMKGMMAALNSAKPDYGPGEPPIMPKKPLHTGNEEEDKAAEEKYKQDMQKYEKDKNEWDEKKKKADEAKNKHAQDIAQQMQGMIKAQEEELRAINDAGKGNQYGSSLWDSQQKKKQDKQQEKEDKQDQELDDLDSEEDESHSREDDDGGAGGTGSDDEGKESGGRYSGHSNRDVKKKKKAVQKRIKTMKRRQKARKKGRLSDNKDESEKLQRYEAELEKLNGEISSRKESGEMGTIVARNRHKKKNQNRLAELEAMENASAGQLPEEQKQELEKLRKQRESINTRKVNVQARRKHDKEIQVQRKRETKQTKKAAELQKKRQNRFANVHGNIFQKLGNKIARGGTDRRMIKQFDHLNKDIEDLEASNPGIADGLKARKIDTSKKVSDLMKTHDLSKEEIKYIEALQKREQLMRNQQDLQETRQTHVTNMEKTKNKNRINRDNKFAGKRASAGRGRRQRKMEGFDYDAASNRDKEIREELKQKEEKLRELNSDTSTAGYKKRLELQREVTELKTEQQKLTSQMDRNDNWKRNNNSQARRERKQEEKINKKYEKKADKVLRGQGLSDYGQAQARRETIIDNLRKKDEEKKRKKAEKKNR